MIQHDEYAHAAISSGNSHGCGIETGRMSGDGTGSPMGFIAIVPDGDGYGCDTTLCQVDIGDGMGSGKTYYAAFARKKCQNGDGNGYDASLSSSGASGVGIVV